MPNIKEKKLTSTTSCITIVIQPNNSKMRSILNISLPTEKKEEIIKRAKKANKSTSAYILHMFELEKNLISEDELVKIANKAEKDYKEGKTKSLQTLEDLMKN